MTRSPAAFGAAAALAAVICAISPARAADADHGRALARQWCAGCHAVEASAKTASDTPPSFASIARHPDVTEDSLRAWLNAPHPSMPNFELSRTAIEDLVAYIRTQK
jgi:mono/diheme cytochrome c family protein